MGQRRASAVHPLHLGLDRQAQGRAAHHRRLPAVGRADDEVDLRLQARRTSSGAPPTSAGSPATRYIAYGPLARRRDRRSCSKACRRTRTRGRFWKMIQKHKVSVFYTAPTAIRSLIKAPRPTRRCTRRATTCRACASSARSASRSIRKRGCGTTRTSAASRCPIVDTWWQTETGGHMITPLPGATPLVPGSCTLPLPGIMAAIVDETGPGRAERAGRHPGRSSGRGRR